MNVQILCDLSYFQKMDAMWPCHQSRLIIGHCVAITASFDEHGLIRNSNNVSHRRRRILNTLKIFESFSCLACQRGGDYVCLVHITATLMWSVI